jgi:hypothetical protein
VGSHDFDGPGVDRRLRDRRASRKWERSKKLDETRAHQSMKYQQLDEEPRGGLIINKQTSEVGIPRRLRVTNGRDA